MSNTTIGIDNIIFDVFRRSDERQLRQIYQKHRVNFVHFATRYFECETSEAGNIFRQAFTILYLNIKKKNIKTFAFSVEQYLFSIGESLLRQQSTIRKEIDVIENIDIKSLDLNIIKKHKHNPVKPILSNLIRSSGEPCRSILKLAYFCDYSTKEIVEQIGYQNEVIANKKKYQCLEALKMTIANEADLQAALLNG